MTLDRPITIQKIDPQGETWADLYTVHASVNKHKTDKEYLSAGAVQSRQYLVFTIRHFKQIEDVATNTQLYRIVYDGKYYDILDYDNYRMQDKTVRLLGGSY